MTGLHCVDCGDPVLTIGADRCALCALRRAQPREPCDPFDVARDSVRRDAAIARESATLAEKLFDYLEADRP